MQQVWQISARPGWFNSILAMAVCAVLAGCTPITSTLIDSVETRQPPVRGITYFLPKSMLRATVVRVSDGTANIIVEKFDATDETLHFSADTHLSPLSNDLITIETSSSGLLKSVTTDLTDQTTAIVEKLSKLIFSSLSGVPSADIRKLPDGTGIPATTLLSIEFDPFVPQQLVDADRKLAKYGYCIVAGGSSVQLPADVCARVVSPSADTAFENPYGGFTAGHAKGIFYRRPIYERVHILKAQGQAFTEVWSSVETFPNRAALLQVEIDRRAFIKMKTTLTFSDGILTKIDIDKQSEVLAGLTLPITVLDAVWKFPALRIQRMELDNGLRERQLNAQQKANELKEREIAIREQEAANANRATFLVQGSQPRVLTPDERQFLLDRCDESFGTAPQCQSDLGLKRP